MRLFLYAIFIILIALLKTEDAVRIAASAVVKTSVKLKNSAATLKQRFLSFIARLLKTSKNFFKKAPLKKKAVYRRKKHHAPHIAFKYRIRYVAFGALFSAIFFFVPLLIFIFLQELPNPNALTLNQSAQTTKIYDRNGILLAQIYANQNRTIIPLSDVPKHLRQATIAIEDKNFYNHMGFDLPSIARAFKVNLEGEKIQGGSTITQQLIKTSFLTPEKSYMRKVKELVLAFWAERIYTKNQILEMYFNQIPYGGTAWGIEAASQTYFGKSTKEIDLAQSAFLAGLTSAPTIYSPYGNNPKLWKTRQKEVLSRMVALGFITQKEANKALNEELVFNKPQIAIYAPHFVTYIKEQLAQKYGLPMLEKGGLIIRTSLDLKTQLMAERIVKEEVAANSYLNLSNGASVITDPKNGDILAMVGSHDWNDPDGGNFNVATSLRQPGSSIKVVTYAAALQKDLTAASIIEDTPVSYPGYGASYTPVNYDGRFHGKVPLRYALANSLNIPAVKTLNRIGIPAMVNMGKNMGIKTWKNPDDYGLSITLGAAEVTMLDMATVYGTLANQGNRIDLNPILKITDSRGNTLEEKTIPHGIQILEKGVAFILSDILADNQARSVEFGSNSPLLIPGHYVSVKTGTTDYKKDNWTNGYTNNYVVVVWVGNNDNTPMSPHLASGITGAAPIWHKIMSGLLSQNPGTKPVPPDEVTQKLCRGKLEYLLKRTANIPECRPANLRFTQNGTTYTNQRP